MYLPLRKYKEKLLEIVDPIANIVINKESKNTFKTNEINVKEDIKINYLKVFESKSISENPIEDTKLEFLNDIDIEKVIEIYKENNTQIKDLTEEIDDDISSTESEHEIIVKRKMKRKKKKKKNRKKNKKIIEEQKSKEANLESVKVECPKKFVHKIDIKKRVPNSDNKKLNQSNNFVPYQNIEPYKRIHKTMVTEGTRFIYGMHNPRPQTKDGLNIVELSLKGLQIKRISSIHHPFNNKISIIPNKFDGSLVYHRCRVSSSQRCSCILTY